MKIIGKKRKGGVLSVTTFSWNIIKNMVKRKRDADTKIGTEREKKDHWNWDINEIGRISSKKPFEI